MPPLLWPRRQVADLRPTIQRIALDTRTPNRTPLNRANASSSAAFKCKCKSSLPYAVKTKSARGIFDLIAALRVVRPPFLIGTKPHHGLHIGFSRSLGKAQPLVSRHFRTSPRLRHCRARVESYLRRRTTTEEDGNGPSGRTTNLHPRHERGRISTLPARNWACNGAASARARSGRGE